MELFGIPFERMVSLLIKFCESKLVALFISKAFDKVWHGTLLSKLVALDINANSSRIISSYPKDSIIRAIIDRIS